MIHFQLPRNISDLYLFLSTQLSETNESPECISGSLSYYMNDIKQRICGQEQSWDVYKRYTNPYEYIHTCVPNKKKSVAKRKPLSRSYFKMIEIMNFFHIIESLQLKSSNLQSFHLAEGPGGFIEALVNLRNNKQDTYTGMTILDDVNDMNIPAWKKSQQFLRDNKNVKIENGADGTGDILQIHNFEYCKQKYARSMHVITGDGGFDFSVDFNNQETISNKLILGQILYALTMQKQGGTFILKIFDMFSKSTQDYIYFLSHYYNKVYIFKPQTSRLANSEKYIICKEFKSKSSRQYTQTFYKIFENNNFQNNRKIINSFFAISLPYFYMSKIEEILNVLCQFQINVINNTIQLLQYNKNDNKTKIDEMIKTNVSKCIQWCIKNNIPYNKNLVRN